MQDQPGQQPGACTADDVFQEYIARRRDGAADIEPLCAARPELAIELRQLHRQWVAFHPHAGKVAQHMPAPVEIGPYHILDTLGEGGMGTVYLAEQKQPVKRRVALKLIKLGMDSKEVVARFEQERQALALMSHDGIAKVYDCGLSDRGQPFFVMEYVKGIPLTHFCEQSKLSLPERILLMRQVCAAVQHAHQKGVVHRDLKPGNVLVSDEGGKPQVKVIDFGLAKAMGERLVEATIFTETGRVIGTPEYMAPEQADSDNRDIDTRADIYSLGVMLYEVLVGSLPFSGKQLRQAGLTEMQRLLREVDPQKPSTRLTSAPGSAAAIAAARRISTGALQKALKNDLDWVVLKALEKDRNRRYETANALSADLQRFLDHEPIMAGPPSAGYRFKKLVRRHRGQFAAASAVVLASLTFGGVAVWQYNRAEQKAVEAIEEKGKAEANATLAQHSERLATAKSADLAAKVREFDQLAARVLHDRAIAGESALYPARPSKVAAMERWLVETDKLLAMRLEIAATVSSLRKRALPWTQVEQQDDRAAHPRHADWNVLQQRVASLRYAQSLRDGGMLVVPELTAGQQAFDASALRSLARPRSGSVEVRHVYGEEPLGLAAARLAAAKAEGTPAAHEFLNTLAWALLANGQDEEAKRASAAAWDQAPPEQVDAYEVYFRAIEAAIENAATALASAERELSALSAEMSQRRTWTFAAEDEALRFLHETLVDLLGKLVSLATKERVEVERRLAWAKQVEELTLHHPQARHTWASVRTAIAASAKYAGCTIDLRGEDVTGLVPIGANPVTGLWEFYELRSAWDGKGDPREIPIPEHRADGSIEVTGETGIVFVLLPGGTFTMGAQQDDPDRPNYDADARADETPHEVTLAPFLLARHELTRAQWHRLMATAPFWWKKGGHYDDDPIAIGTSHPADSLDWDDASRCMERHGLVLPTEAQWEYGCRAGTTTPWWPGAKATDLQGIANLYDQVSGQRTPWINAAPITDGFTAIAPVGRFGGNAFGLYDVHGNVWEWCRDRYADYAAGVGEDNSQRLIGMGATADNRAYRGGGCGAPASGARSAVRSGNPPSFRDSGLGVRPARSLGP